MKIVSFNIRCDYNQDGKNNFCYRKEKILKKIKEEQPDVIGFQEVLPHVQKWLRETLTEYIIVGCGRSETFQGEYMTIALRRETVELYGLDIFWLSPEPENPGSRYPKQSICPRTCASVLIKYESFSMPIRIYNTHLDHEESEARKLGLEQILNRMEQDKKRYATPVILMGDFNAEPDKEELSGISEGNSFGLTDTTEELGITFHNYGKKEEECKIDYLLIDETLLCTDAVLWKDCENGIYLSDHYPLCAEIHLK